MHGAPHNGSTACLHGAPHTGPTAWSTTQRLYCMENHTTALLHGEPHNGSTASSTAHRPCCMEHQTPALLRHPARFAAEVQRKKVRMRPARPSLYRCTCMQASLASCYTRMACAPHLATSEVRHRSSGSRMSGAPPSTLSACAATTPRPPPQGASSTTSRDSCT
jgi:hypothetical protein